MGTARLCSLRGGVDLLAAGVHVRRRDGWTGTLHCQHYWLTRETLWPPRLRRTHDSKAGLAESGAWAPQRSTASHVVQPGAQGPITVQRHERTPRIGGSRYWEISRAPLSLLVFLSCPLCTAATHAPIVETMTKTPSTLPTQSSQATQQDIFRR